MAKDLSSIGSSTIKVEAKDFHIDFIADADGILKRKVTFGEDDDSSGEEDDRKSNNVYEATFATDQIARITKLAGLSTTMQIFPTTGLPLLFRTSVGSLGKISVYVKSKEEIEAEANPVAEEDDDDSDDE